MKLIPVTVVAAGIPIACSLALLHTVLAPTGAGAQPKPVDAKKLQTNFELSVRKRKGPYTENTCVCADNSREPVTDKAGRVRPQPCGKKGELFCSAFRAPWGAALAEEGLYLGNIFSRDVYLWDTLEHHHDVVRGYILERYFADTYPEHKLSMLRAFGGLSGAEYEAAAIPSFFERYLSLPDFRDEEHFLLAYELQRRFFVRMDLGRIDRIRSLSSRISQAHPRFKPVRDAIHNQVSAHHVAVVEDFRRGLPKGSDTALFDELAAELRKLTGLSEIDLAPGASQLQDPAARSELLSRIERIAGEKDAAEAIVAISVLLARCRELGKEPTRSRADRRRLVDVAVGAGAVLAARAAAYLDAGAPRPVTEIVTVLRGLADATYGTGLISQRERQELFARLDALRSAKSTARLAFFKQLREADRIAQWAQGSVRHAFAPVMPAWTTVLPQVAYIGDDVIRSSPALFYARLSQRLADHVGRDLGLRHDVLGLAASESGAVRALNAGVAVGELAVDPKPGTHTRDHVVALRETPADLDPAAGIITMGEGNIVSHVQLLARNLGVPNATVGPGAMKALGALAGHRVALIVTPLGRVLVKEAEKMTSEERSVVEEYVRNRKPRADRSLTTGTGGKILIDPSRLDLARRSPIPLAAIRRTDSGRLAGPKAAYLGELRHLFPGHVSRGIVVPFGAYHEHYQRASLALAPGEESWSPKGGTVPLPGYVDRTYEHFFKTLVSSGKSERELAEWIRPRLQRIQNALREAPLSAALESELKAAFRAQKLFLDAREDKTTGVFVRSDTNIEDLETFTGAGLNLTVFNLASFGDVLRAIKDVWASPFSYRSFSWRQAVIDQPRWVLPSILILESVASEKSGVLITADVHGDTGEAMTIATSEGVGGAVDGAPAETLTWSPGGVSLVAQFKSHWRRVLLPTGGTEIAPCSGRDRVLSDEEVSTLVGFATRIRDSLEPTRDDSGRARPWDIEFGFADGKLWLFQVRPFVGNDDVANLPALNRLDGGAGRALAPVTPQEEVSP